jgi:flagellar FliL protein
VPPEVLEKEEPTHRGLAIDVQETGDAPDATPKSAAAMAKVALDLDDAPFLHDEEKEKPEERADDSDAKAIAEAAARIRARRRKMMIGAAAALLLIVGASVWFFVLRKGPEVPVEPPKPEVVVVPSKPQPQAEKKTYIKELLPLVVHHDNPKGGTDFLICKFSVLSSSPTIARDIDLRLLSVRDAAYYYLRSKPISFLTDAANAAAIKKDLVAVINDYLTQGEAEDVLFESYLSE